MNSTNELHFIYLHFIGSSLPNEVSKRFSATAFFCSGCRPTQRQQLTCLITLTHLFGYHQGDNNSSRPAGTAIGTPTSSSSREMATVVTYLHTRSK